MFSYTVCTGLAIAFGMIISTLMLGIFMTTKLYSKFVAKIVRTTLLSDEYDSIMKEMAKKSIDTAISSVTSVDLDNYQVSVERKEDGA